MGRYTYPENLAGLLRTEIMEAARLAAEMSFTEAARQAAVMSDLIGTNLSETARHVAGTNLMEAARLAADMSFTEAARQAAAMSDLTRASFAEAIRQADGLKPTKAVEMSLAEALQSSFYPLNNHLKDFAFSSIIDTIAKEDFAYQILREADAIADSDIHVEPDGSLSVNGELIDTDEITQALAALVDEAETFFGDLPAALSRFREPIQAILLRILKPLASIVVTLVISLHFHERSSLQLEEVQEKLQTAHVETRREILAKLKNIPREQKTSPQLRLVIGDGLRVRTRPGSKYKIKRLLRIGTVVRFIEKKGKWTLVEYNDDIEESTLDYGWVSNKYLKHIRR